jgi:hypothetical protein
MARQVGAALLAVLIAVVAFGRIVPVSAASGDKQLTRVKGSVGYKNTLADALHPVFSREDLPDDAYAVTGADAAALLTLRDSSQVEIGSTTTVQVGAFNAVGAGQNQITLAQGALHFKVLHPQGGQSNYTFTTPTSQIAVRGTEGLVAVGSQGTQIACVACQPGDVVVQVGTKTFTLVTGQGATVLGTSAANATISVVNANLINNPAFNQFYHGVNPLGSSAGHLADPTGSASGAGSGAGAGAGAGGGLGGLGGLGAGTTLGLAAAGAALAGLVVADASKPTPSPAPTPVPTATPVATPSPTASPSPGPSVNVSSSPTAAPTPSPSSTYSALAVNPTTVSIASVPGSGTFTVQQTGPAGTITIAQPNCGGDGAAATDSPNTVTFNPSSAATTITVSAAAAPTASPPPTTACTIAITGANGQSATVNVNIRSTGVIITSKKQH